MAIKELRNFVLYYKVHKVWLREAFGEFLGTFILVLFGDAAIAQTVLSRQEHGNIVNVCLGWGVAVMLALYVSAGVSGGHINPSVSLTMSVFGRLPWKKLPIYMLSQYLGAFFASAVLYGLYVDALDAFDGGIRQTVGENATAFIWATYPAEYISNSNAFFDQVVNTGGMMLCILAIIDERNMEVSKQILPIAVGLLVYVIAAAMSLNCMAAINPARDLAPRLFTAMAGWGHEPFSINGYNWFWIPIIGPHVGALLGAGMYQIFIGRHWPVVVDNSTELAQICSAPDKKFTSDNVNIKTPLKSENFDEE